MILPDFNCQISDSCDDGGGYPSCIFFAVGGSFSLLVTNFQFVNLFFLLKILPLGLAEHRIKFHFIIFPMNMLFSVEKVPFADTSNHTFIWMNTDARTSYSIWKVPVFFTSTLFPPGTHREMILFIASSSSSWPPPHDFPFRTGLGSSRVILREGGVSRNLGDYPSDYGRIGITTRYNLDGFNGVHMV